MKKLILSLAAFAAIGAYVVNAQGQAPASATADKTANLPVKIGLVDMARVFKEYGKFTSLREELQAEMVAMQDEAKSIKAQVNKLAEQMKQLNADSPEYRAIEEKIAKQTSEFEARMRLKQRDLARREAEIFETVYMEASDVVKQYAEYYKFTIVMRFNSESIDSDNPQKLANGLNKLVIYHRPQDDITDPVIEYLNRKQDKKKTPSATTTPGPERIGNGNTGSGATRTK